MNIYEKLTKIQNELKVPKNRSGNGVKYKFRNVEDIQEASKVVLMGNKCAAYVQDKVITVGERYFVEATATLVNSEAPEERITVTAQAELDEASKMMSKSQNTGSTSSYARKYALGGLYNLDDTEDDDGNYNPTDKQGDRLGKKVISKEKAAELYAIGERKGFNKATVNMAIKKDYEVYNATELDQAEYETLKARLSKAPDKKAPEPEEDFSGTPFEG